MYMSQSIFTVSECINYLDDLYTRCFLVSPLFAGSFRRNTKRMQPNGVTYLITNANKSSDLLNNFVAICQIIPWPTCFIKETF